MFFNGDFSREEVVLLSVSGKTETTVMLTSQTQLNLLQEK